MNKNEDNSNSSKNIIRFLPKCCRKEHGTEDMLQNESCRKYTKHVVILAVIFIIIAIIISQCKLLEVTSRSVPYKWCLLLKNIPPRRGDLCVLDYRGKTLVKYLMGKTGDRVQISNNDILVNGKIVGRVSEEKRLNLIDLNTVPEGQVFVLGTHPDSFDSRYKEFGFVKKSALKGKAIGLKKW